MPRTRKPGTAFARHLRRSMTDAERRLWWHLGRVPVESGHFRKQVPLGPYIVDFALLSARLVIEVDGDQHGREPYAEKDRTRTAWLEAQGFRVLRFTNIMVLREVESILDTIHAALYEPSGSASTGGADTPIPSPSPQGGGE